MERPDRMRPLGRHRLRWEDNIKTDFQDFSGEAWTGLIWPTILGMAGSCKSDNEASDSIKCGEYLDELRTISQEQLRFVELVSEEFGIAQSVQ